ncbi:MAG TPA: hypothetical protein DHW71_08595 [Gammaproteobacteria bacterium]|nr:hypothetical protein [Gammaproteobacteria bacterium]MEC8012542.1 type II secretion system minor pseudopilin GspK [Pseudomonadota bacterium]HCK93031.1 hypothetical protein [Gammaproteobacteria bacterium]|tara:strand:+ start:10665 stop:11648 length:984 start_codon:yes stop_codon:yes gene_type:complete
MICQQGYKSNTQGIVLISVLLIFAATTVLVAGLQMAFMRTVKSQGLVAADSQVQEYLRGAELLASIQLQQDVYNDMQNAETRDHASEQWAQLQVYPITGGEIRTQLVDLQGRFNIMTLASDQTAQQVFIRLLDELQIPSDNRMTSSDILTVILDWMDTDQEQRGFIEAEDDYYLSLGSKEDGGYKTSQKPIMHLSELLLLRGVSKQDYAKLAPYIALLPLDASININSVSLPVARALNVSAGAELVSTRPEEGFTQEDMSTLSENQRPAMNFNVDSQYFELRTQIKLGDALTQQSTIIYVPASTNAEEIETPQLFQRDLGWAYYYSL